MKILVTGAEGQLGQELGQASRVLPAHQLVLAGRSRLDITDASAVQEFLSREKFDLVIHAAAYTAVDKAENEPGLARAVNVTGTQNIANACAENRSFLVHISSDFVFDGTKSTAYREEDATSALSVYGQSKEEAEKVILQSQARAAIVRTSWVYSAYGHNFVKTIVRLARERSELKVVDDQIGSPTWAADLAGFLLAIAPALPGVVKDKEIFHYSNEGVASWYDFARAIVELSGNSCQVLPIPSADYPVAAKRPPFSVLSKEKTRKQFSLPIAYWRDSLRLCLQQLQANTGNQ